MPTAPLDGIDRDCEGLKWIGISLSEEKMTCMYQRFFMQAAKKALKHHACKGVFKVEIDNYSNSLTMTTYLCVVSGSVLYYYEDVDETVVDFVPLDITDLKIGSSGEVIIQIADETVGSTKYSIKMFVVEDSKRQHWINCLIQAGCRYISSGNLSQTPPRKKGGENHRY